MRRIPLSAVRSHGTGGCSRAARMNPAAARLQGRVVARRWCAAGVIDRLDPISLAAEGDISQPLNDDSARQLETGSPDRRLSPSGIFGPCFPGLLHLLEVFFDVLHEKLAAEF